MKNGHQYGEQPTKLPDDTFKKCHECESRNMTADISLKIEDRNYRFCRMSCLREAANRWEKSAGIRL